MQIPDYLVTRLTSVDFQEFRKDWYRIEITHWKAASSAGSQDLGSGRH